MTTVLYVLFDLAFGLMVFLPLFALHDRARVHSEKKLGYKLRTHKSLGYVPSLVWVPDVANPTKEQRKAANKESIRTFLIGIPIFIVWFFTLLYLTVYLVKLFF